MSASTRCHTAIPCSPSPIFRLRGAPGTIAVPLPQFQQYRASSVSWEPHCVQNNVNASSQGQLVLHALAHHLRQVTDVAEEAQRGLVRLRDDTPQLADARP